MINGRRKAETMDFLHTVGSSASWYSYLGKCIEIPQKIEKQIYQMVCLLCSRYMSTGKEIPTFTVECLQEVKVMEHHAYTPELVFHLCYKTDNINNLKRKDLFWLTVLDASVHGHFSSLLKGLC